VACQICEKECPPQCIYIEKSKDKKPDHLGKPQFYPATFDIDLSVCMSCQICVEVCPFDAIKMDQEFELATADRFGGLLLSRKTGWPGPTRIFRRSIRRDAGEIDTRPGRRARQSGSQGAGRCGSQGQAGVRCCSCRGGGRGKTGEASGGDGQGRGWGVSRVAAMRPRDSASPGKVEPMSIPGLG
jgi:Pyruvate/2-oxoacid:ferredoxin oxidoreductase delta subunit